MTKPIIFVSTCEFSGDMHGEVLINEIRKLLPDVYFYGIGGSRMAAAGAEIIYDPTAKSTIGFIEVLKNIKKMKRLLADIIKEWERRRPDLILWLDSGGFNLPLAKAAKERGIPVVCMFSPSAWAYGEERAVKLADRVKLLLAVLPFEAEFYRKFGANAVQVGHPLLDRVVNTISSSDYRKKLGLQPGQKMVVLMPGSRRQEIERLLHPMLRAAVEISQTIDVKYVLPVAASLDRTWLESLISKYQVNIAVVTDGAYNPLAAADGAVISSGTATLEAAILNTPMVIVYQISKLSFMIYRCLESSQHKQAFFIGLPNLIMGKSIIPELIQEDLTSSNIARHLRQILEDDSYNYKIRRELAEVKKMIGPPGVMGRAARYIADILTEKR